MDDEQLIQTALRLDNEDWNGAYSLARLAQTEQTRAAIEKIARRYYHNEEYSNGDL